MNKNKLPKISIVTVAFNCEAIIGATIESVMAQTYPNIEYVIIEGKSKDGTLDVIETYREHVDVLVSEKDKNLYDAMNKGMANATGDYIWFLHAGDIALEPDTLEKAFANHNDEDFVYGKVKVVDVEGNEIPWHKQHPDAKKLSWRSFRNGMVICHQAMFPHRRIWEDYDYEQYTLVADLDWSLRIMKKARTYRDTNTVVCSFLKGGISAQNRKASLWQRFYILRKHFGLLPTLWEHVLIAGQAARRGKISH